MISETKLASDELRQAVPNLGVPRHGSPAAIGRVGVDVVSCSVAKQVTSSPSEFTDELTSVQELHLDIARKNRTGRRRRFGVGHELVGVANVLL